jgi:hypothetical protein
MKTTRTRKGMNETFSRGQSRATKSARRLDPLTAAPACAVTVRGATTHARARETQFDKLASLPFMEDRPTKETAQTLRDELLFQRATQTCLWALPLINTMGMKDGSEKAFGSGYNILPVWKKRLDAKTLVTTPNSDVIIHHVHQFRRHCAL